MQRVLIYCFPVYFLHHCLPPKAVSSVAWGRFGVGASQNGDFCSSTMQEYLPRFLPKLCKPDLLLADRSPPPPLPWGYLTEIPSGQPVQQQHRSILPSVELCQLSCSEYFWEQVPFASPICCFHPQLALSRMMSRDVQTCWDLLSLRTRGVCTPDTLQVWTTWSQPTCFTFSDPGFTFLKKYSYSQKRGDFSWGTGPILISQ